MATKKVYRIYVDRNSDLFDLLERMPAALRGEYIRLALKAFKPFNEVPSGGPDKKESKSEPASYDFQ